MAQIPAPQCQKDSSLRDSARLVTTCHGNDYCAPASPSTMYTPLHLRLCPFSSYGHLLGHLGNLDPAHRHLGTSLIFYCVALVFSYFFFLLFLSCFVYKISYTNNYRMEYSIKRSYEFMNHKI